MKHIIKQGEPPAFAEWKLLENQDWKPTYDTLAGEPKRALHNALMAEQGYICCYCERRLEDHDSHIEHFKPQHKEDVDPLDFDNMLCSCQNQIKKSEPRHCGNLKDKWFAPSLLISPLNPGCENRFAFTGDGGIKPQCASDQAAAITIEKLGLAIPKLNALRSKVIEPFLDDDLSAQDMQTFVAGYLNKDESGKFGEFWTTIHYLFRDYAHA